MQNNIMPVILSCSKNNMQINPNYGILYLFKSQVGRHTGQRELHIASLFLEDVLSFRDIETRSGRMEGNDHVETQEQ